MVSVSNISLDSNLYFDIFHKTMIQIFIFLENCMKLILTFKKIEMNQIA